MSLTKIAGLSEPTPFTCQLSSFSSSSTKVSLLDLSKLAGDTKPANQKLYAEKLSRFMMRAEEIKVILDDRKAKRNDFLNRVSFHEEAKNNQQAPAYESFREAEVLDGVSYSDLSEHDAEGKNFGQKVFSMGLTGNNWN
jgi:hypothetical protein